MSGVATIRRLTEFDRERLIPRLVKFCQRHKIFVSMPSRDERVQLEKLGLGTDDLACLSHDITSWVAEGELDGTMGVRAQMARRVWQRAVREPRAEFGTFGGYIVKM